MRTHRLTITTCSPLHIGSGEPALRKDTDFAEFRGTLYMLNIPRVLDYVVGPNLERLEEVSRTVNLASFLNEADLQAHPELVLYRMPGSARVREVLPHFKNVFDRPVIPGSSLKGTFRTIILDSALVVAPQPIDVRHLDSRAKFAAQELERDVAGRGERASQAPNYDLFRTLRVADSAPGEQEWFTLSNVRIWPASEQGIPLDVETIGSGHSFTSSMSIDDFLFGPHAAKLGFAEKRHLMTSLAERGRAQARYRIEQERQFYKTRDLPQLEQFYQALADQLAGCDDNSFLVQIGWGAGWGSKTLVRTIDRADAVDGLVQQYRLDRGRGRGGEFPATRHLVVDRQAQPIAPFGWLRISIEDLP